MTNTNLKIKQLFASGYENHKKNNFDLAKSFYEKILNIDKNHIETIYLLGTLFLQQRNFEKSIKLFNQVLSINPNHVNGLHNLATLFIETANYKDAKKLLEKVIKIQPKHIHAYYNLGNIHKYFAEYEKAEKSYKISIKNNPYDAKVYNNLGNVLKDLGKFDEAIECYNKAIKIEPSHANAYHNLGNTAKQLGNFSNAKIFYEKAVNCDPSNLETLSTLFTLEKKDIDANLKKKLDKIVIEKKISHKNLAYANFMLAKHEFKKKNFENELDYLTKGHLHYFDFKKNIFSSGVKYWLNDIPNTKELMSLKIDKNFKSKNNNIKPIFIVGVPRCGSTLVEKVIASGSKVFPTGEETAIISYWVAKKVLEGKSLNSDLEDTKKSIIDTYKNRGLIKKENDYVFSDKSLDNFFFIGLIKTIFPKAKIINCKRKALSSIVSILRNNLGDVAWAHKIENIFEYFDIYYKKIESFKKIYPDLIYELELEKFVHNPEYEAKNLMKFCEIPWDKKCLDYYKRKDLVSKTASNIQIREGIYKEAKDKNEPYKKLLSAYGKKYSWFN